jgi:hypothetical protein
MGSRSAWINADFDAQPAPGGELTLTGAYLMCSGIFMALMPALAWIPAVFFGRRAGDERYFSVGFYNVVWATTIGVVASITAVVLYSLPFTNRARLR